MFTRSWFIRIYTRCCRDQAQYSFFRSFSFLLVSSVFFLIAFLLSLASASIVSVLYIVTWLFCTCMQVPCWLCEHMSVTDCVITDWLLKEVSKELIYRGPKRCLWRWIEKLWLCAIIAAYITVLTLCLPKTDISVFQRPTLACQRRRFPSLWRNVCFSHPHVTNYIWSHCMMCYTVRKKKCSSLFWYLYL